MQCWVVLDGTLQRPPFPNEREAKTRAMEHIEAGQADDICVQVFYDDPRTPLKTLRYDPAKEQWFDG